MSSNGDGEELGKSKEVMSKNGDGGEWSKSNKVLCRNGDKDHNNEKQNEQTDNTVDQEYKSSKESIIGTNIYMMKKKKLNPLEVLEIFNNVDVSRITEEIDFRPNAGNVYLYAIKKDKETDEDWKCDGYTFWQNGSRNVS